MQYFIPVNEHLFEKARKERHYASFIEVDDTPVSRLARYMQDYLFQQSGIYLSDEEIRKHEQSCLASKNNCFDHYPSKQTVASNKKTHPIVNMLYRILHIQGIRVTLTPKSDAEKKESAILPALKQKIDSLRQQAKIRVTLQPNNCISLTRDNQSFFTRSMIAQKIEGHVTHHVNNWANVVIIENTNTQKKTAYIYDSQTGLNDAVFMYGLNHHHKIICSGLVKSTTHKINDHITIPRLFFCPHACATREKEDTFNHNFLLYAMSLHTPINLGFVKTPDILEPKTAYVYGGFANDEERQKADKQYDIVLEGIREKQKQEAQKKKEASLVP